MKPIPFVVAAIAVFSAGAALASQYDIPATEVSPVEVVNDNTVILRIEVSGDMGPRTVVKGDVPGINCGPDRYKYTEGENRQCWVWVRRGKPINLAALGMKGEYGAGWTVEWEGCEVREGGAACYVAPPDKETHVRARFSGAPL
ncbi:MAG TPA: hypothetical protein VEA44_08865 [Caulobacter sp.]|nr:hypothetical protein [Caulobacter sp.]